MDNNNKVVDNHTLYFWCNDLESHEVKKEFHIAIDTMKQEHGIDFTGTNLILKVIKNNARGNYGYAYVENTGLYNCIMGKNVDGSTRKVNKELEIEDEPFVAPDNWNRLSDDEKFEVLKKFYTNAFSDELANHHENENTKTEPDVLLPPLIRFKTITCQAAFTSKNNVSNNFIAYDVPKHISGEMVFEIFKPFTSKNTYIYNKKTKQKSYYPLIYERYIDGKRSISVSFEPRSVDGYFAYLIHRICNIDESTTIYFNVSRQ